MSNLIELKEVVKEYRIRDNEIKALNGVNLKIEKATMVAVVGKSGSGKTTLLNVIGALDRPTSGEVYVDGLDLNKLTEKDLVKYRSSKVGFVFQDYNLIPNLNGLENVMLAMEYAGRPNEEARKRALELLEVVIMDHRAYHRPSRLSGGEQQRVAIARALANDPPLLLADEPTGNLDSETGKDIVKLLKHFVEEKGKTAIVVTHDSSITEIAHEHINIRDGRIVG